MSESNTIRDSVVMDGATTRVETHRLTTAPGATNKAAVAGAGDDVYGVTLDYVTKDNKSVSVDVLGEVTVEAHAAFPKGCRLKAAAGGRAAQAIAALTTALGSTNRDLTFTAKPRGRDGDLISVKYTDPSANSQALAVTVNGYEINVSLATGSTGTITSTAALIKAAIEASPKANALVAVTYPTGNDGSGVVVAMAQTFLSGGAGDFATALQAATAQGQYIRAAKDRC